MLPDQDLFSGYSRRYTGICQTGTCPRYPCGTARSRQHAPEPRKTVCGMHQSLRRPIRESRHRNRRLWLKSSVACLFLTGSCHGLVPVGFTGFDQTAHIKFFETTTKCIVFHNVIPEEENKPVR